MTHEGAFLAFYPIRLDCVPPRCSRASWVLWKSKAPKKFYLRVDGGCFVKTGLDCQEFSVRNAWVAWVWTPLPSRGRKRIYAARRAGRINNCVSVLNQDGKVVFIQRLVAFKADTNVLWRMRMNRLYHWKKNRPAAIANKTTAKQVGDMASRKLKAQRHVNKTVWSGLGMMGLIGWS